MEKYKYENGLYVANRESKDPIDKTNTIEEARSLIEQYELNDEKEDCYSPNYYCVIEVTDGTLFSANTIE